MAKDFIFELGCEELPSHAVWPLAAALVDELRAGLEKASLQYKDLRAFATPRRLALIITALDEEQPKQHSTRRGPALAAAYGVDGEPSSALLGFAKSCGVSPSQLQTLENEKGSWLVYEALVEGSTTASLLPTLIQRALSQLPIAKLMRWGSGEEAFVRPVHWAVMLWGEELLNCEVLGVKTGLYTYGHRFHHPHALELTQASAYQATLKKAFVIADFAERRAMIVQQVEQLAASYRAIAVMPDWLIDEVTSIVEWPEALIADFKDDFLKVPPEALIASMQAHQKCFALQDTSGKLLPHFITVANIRSTNPKQVILGNEKVMHARLSDAAFFFAQDKKQPLAALFSATEKVIFQARLGSLEEKSQRISALMNFLAPLLDLNEQEARRAALLSKCDLLTGMVGEFPELQGIMGSYYAEHDGESLAVALAIKEQYLPAFANDKLPSSNLGLALALAERIDNLVGIFGLGEKPSGVKDPFKLRRQALAVVRLLLATPAALSLSELIATMQAIYSKKLPDLQAVTLELQPFILDRLSSFYQSQNFTQDLIQAVSARQADYLYDFDKRLHAVADFIQLPEASILSVACKRVNNFLQQRDSVFTAGQGVDEHLLEVEAEKNLFEHLKKIEQLVVPLYEEANYEKILTHLTTLKKPVDLFFEKVMVMTDNQAIRANRLQLLSRLQNLLQGVADLSLLQN